MPASITHRHLRASIIAAKTAEPTLSHNDLCRRFQCQWNAVESALNPAFAAAQLAAVRARRAKVKEQREAMQ